uniref:Uncharacterized protein n=1 Tax=Timema tahoe TaxID=61484 RepID=A0A7R9IN38_9NEOP|nr:unnamed protein product [Timema tahoe]
MFTNTSKRHCRKTVTKYGSRLVEHQTDTRHEQGHDLFLSRLVLSSRQTGARFDSSGKTHCHKEERVTTSFKVGDDPPYLAVGTEVSAKYKGAFCEAKVRKVVRSVKCKDDDMFR